MIRETTRRAARTMTRVWFRCDACGMTGSVSCGHDDVDATLATITAAHEQACYAVAHTP